MDTTHVTVGHRTRDGWECVDDHGRRVAIAADAVDPALRDLRTGQRLRVETDAHGLISHAALP